VRGVRRRLTTSVAVWNGYVGVIVTSTYGANAGAADGPHSHALARS
jgi:hypothetical protein